MRTIAIAAFAALLAACASHRAGLESARGDYIPDAHQRCERDADCVPQSSGCFTRQCIAKPHQKAPLAHDTDGTCLAIAYHDDMSHNECICEARMCINRLTGTFQP